MTDEEIIAQRLQKMRKERKFTHQNIADFLGVERSTYTYYEIGRRCPSTSTLKKLANLYGVSMSYLLGETAEIDIISQRDVTDAVAEERERFGTLTKEESILIGYFRVMKDEDKEKLFKALKEAAAETNKNLN